MCSRASNPTRQVLLARRAASFIKVIAPKAFPSFSWFNEEPEHPLDASLWLLGRTASGSCRKVGTGTSLPSAPTAIAYKAQHGEGQGELLRARFVARTSILASKAAKKFVAPFGTLTPVRKLGRFGTPHQPFPKPRSLNQRPNPRRSWQLRQTQQG